MTSFLSISQLKTIYLIHVISAFGWDRPYVLIVRGDGFPCGSCPWVQLAIEFANHGQEARTLAYNWTIDVALTSEHNIDALRAIFSKTLEAIQSIMNTGWILIREKWYRARVMLRGDSPWLRKVLRSSSYFQIGGIYTYATWCAVKGRWEDRKWRRSPRSDKKLYKLHKKGLDCTTAKGCVSEPLLHIEERFKFVVMCILHLVIRVGNYRTKLIRKKCKHLLPATRDRVQDRLNCAKTKISLKGHASPDGKETWLLLANWRHIGKAMNLPNHVIDLVVQMASLLTALKIWEFNSNTLDCKSIAKKFKRTIWPTIRSPYLLWLQFDAPEVLKNLHLWGCGMFSGDIVESLNYLLKDHFLCSWARGGGKGTPTECDTRLVTQALEHLFLAKEMPRWQRANAD